MKKLLAIAAGTAIGGILCAQTPGTSGQIRFEENVHIEINLGGSLPPGMDSIPKEHRSEKVLLFNADASLFSNSKSNAAAEPEPPEGSGITRIVMQEPEDIVYCDMKEMKTTEQKEFMSRNFLISSDLKRFQWKLTGRHKTILGYPCQEAAGTDTAKKATAWFTTLIPVSSGPAGYGNLPGMILELTLENGDRTYTAAGIEMKSIDNKLIEKPKKGKKMTYEEYLAMVEEKMKESGGTGGGHMMMIRITR